MKRIREDIWEVDFRELGEPMEPGVYEVHGLGEVFLDVADLRYVGEHRKKGHLPVFFVARSAAMGGRFVVRSRQVAA